MCTEINYNQLLAGPSPNGQIETNARILTDTHTPTHARRRDADCGMELCWKPRAFHGQRQPPELCTHTVWRRRRQRDGAPLEATGFTTEGQPLELCRPVGETRDGEEGPQQSLAAMAAALFSSLPPKRRKQHRERKETLDAPKENDLTKLGIPLYCKTGNALTGAPPSFYRPRREGNTT